MDRHILLDLQAGQDGGQAQIALLIVADSGHDLLVSHRIACLLQLLGQSGQFVGMGGIVVCHILHQRHQLLHGGVLVVAAATAVTAALVVVAVLMAVAVVVAMLVAVTIAMAVVMGMTLTVQMIVLVGMLMVMRMGMLVGMGMGHTVMGMLMGVGVVMFVGMGAMAQMIVMQMHSHRSFAFFFHYI